MWQNVGNFLRLLTDTAEIANEEHSSFIRMALGMLALGLIMVTATLAGIGGSPAIFPICLIFFKMDLQSSIAMTSLYTLVGFIARLVYEVRDTLKDPSRRKINYHVAIIGAPFMSLGAYFGVTFNKLGSKLSIMIGMVLLSLYCLHLTFE